MGNANQLKNPLNDRFEGLVISDNRCECGKICKCGNGKKNYAVYSIKSIDR